MHSSEKPITMKMSLTFKYILTFSLFFCYFVYGVNFYVVGPTLIELAGLFQTTIEKICLIYTVRSAGYTLGSLSGFLFKYINRQLIFVFFLAVMGVTLAAMPHVSSLTMLFVLAGINGFSIGTFDTAINVWILEIWQEDSGPFMQALHFTYGIGSFVAPLICEPFLSTEAVHGGHGPPAKAMAAETSTLSSILSSTVPPPTTSVSSALLMLANDTGLDLNATNGIDPVDFLIYIPYAVAGGITIVGAMLILVLYYVNKYEPPKKPSRKEYELTTIDENGEAIEPVIVKQKTPTITITLVGMGSLFLTFFVGMEQMHLQFLPTFAVNTDLSLSPSSAAMMSSVAALAFTIGRCLSIPLAIKLRPQTILYTNHALMLTGCILLAIYANSREDMLWLANAILGLGFSSVYASIYAFLEQQIRVTNRVGSMFVFAGGLTAAVSPSLVGQYIEANPLILVWFNLACCLLCLAIFVAIHMVVSFTQKRQRKLDMAKADALLSKDLDMMVEDGDVRPDSHMDLESRLSDANNEDTITQDKKLIHRCLIETDRARTNSNMNLLNNNFFDHNGTGAQRQVAAAAEDDASEPNTNEASLSSSSSSPPSSSSSSDAHSNDDEDRQARPAQAADNVNEPFIVPA